MSACGSRTACVRGALFTGSILALILVVLVPTAVLAVKGQEQAVDLRVGRQGLAPALRSLLRSCRNPLKRLVRWRRARRGTHQQVSAQSLGKNEFEQLVALEKRRFQKAPWDRERLDQYRHLTTVFKSDGRLVGYVVLVDPQRDDYTPLHGPPLDTTGAPYLYVAHLAVHPDLAGNGVGSEILGKTFQRARRVGKQEVRLHVRATNGARTFYKKQGFREGGTLEQVYPNVLTGNGVREDALEMNTSVNRVPSPQDVRKALRSIFALPQRLLGAPEPSPTDDTKPR